MIADTDKAYIAGLFDGEGSIYTKSKERKRNTKVWISRAIVGVLVWRSL